MPSATRAATMAMLAVLVLGSACGDDRPADTTTPVSRAEAPDFTLRLGGGGTFVLSEEARPVFMVFWAEW